MTSTARTLAGLRGRIWQAVADIRDAAPRTPNDASTDDIADAVVALIADDEAVTVHQHRIAKVQAEAAVAIVGADRAEMNRIRDILKLVGREVIVKTVDLGMGTWVIETENGPFAKSGGNYTVIHNNRATSTYHHSLDEALLRAIELRNGGGANSQGYQFAARALRVPLRED